MREHGIALRRRAGSSGPDGSCLAVAELHRDCRPRRRSASSRSCARRAWRYWLRRARCRRSPSRVRQAATQAPAPRSRGRRRTAGSRRLTHPFAPDGRVGVGGAACAQRAEALGREPRQRPHRHGAHQRRRVVEVCLDQRGRASASPELPAAISTLRRKRSRPVRLIGVPAKRARNAASSRTSSSESGGLSLACPHRELRLARALREFVPRADGEAIVAAEDAVAHGRAITRRDVPLVLDGEVGDAGARIDPIGRGEGARRADIEAAPAGPAMILLGLRRARSLRW